MSNNWLIGVLMNIIGSVGSSSGLLTQKKAAIQVEEMIKSGIRPYRRIGGIILSPMWLLGFCLVLFVPVPLDFIAYQFVAQSLVAPLGAMSVVFTMLLAPCITKEEVTRLDYFGAGLILIGCGITTVAGTHVDILYGYSDLYTFVSSSIFLTMEGILAFVAIISYLLIQIKSIEEHPRYKKFRPAFFGFISGFFGSLENVILKCTSNIITISGFYASWEFYICAIMVIVFAILQISWLNKGLEHFESTTFLPIYNTSLILLSTLVGSVFFEEYVGQSTQNLLLFILGCLVACGGVTVIALQDESSDPGNAVKNAPVINASVSVFHIIESLHNGPKAFDGSMRSMRSIRSARLPSPSGEVKNSDAVSPNELRAMFGRKNSLNKSERNDIGLNLNRQDSSSPSPKVSLSSKRSVEAKEERYGKSVAKLADIIVSPVIQEEKDSTRSGRLSSIEIKNVVRVVDCNPPLPISELKRQDSLNVSEYREVGVSIARENSDIFSGYSPKGSPKAGTPMLQKDEQGRIERKTSEECSF